MELRKPRGTEDLYDNKIFQFNALELIIRNLIRYYNFSELKTPIFESKELFTQGIGNETDIVTKEMFEFNDKKDRNFVLRPEGTTAIARCILENKFYQNTILPLKYFYFGPMFRYERPQKGRLRQFNQFGVEVVGIKNYLIDCEILIFGYNLIHSLGLENISLELNFLPSIDQKQQYIIELKKYLLNKNLCLDCQTRINKNPLRVLDCKTDSQLFNNAPKTIDFLSKEDYHYFNQIQKFLTNINIPYNLNSNLVRGLDYYTSLVFEIVSNEENITIIGGGRYDELFSLFDSKVNLPAVGFGLGIERLLLLLEKQKINLAEFPMLDAYLICLSQKSFYFASNLAIMLRNNQISCDLDYAMKSLKQQFKNANKLKAKYVIIIGDKELQNNYVTIKEQNTGNENNVAFNDIINYLQKGENN